MEGSCSEGGGGGIIQGECPRGVSYVGQLFVGYYLSRKELFRGNCPGANSQEKIVWGGQLFRRELLIVQGGGTYIGVNCLGAVFPWGIIQRKISRVQLPWGDFIDGRQLFVG